MKAVERILCATDLSPASGAAWAFAQRLALAAKAELVLLHVMPSIPVPEAGPLDASAFERLADELRAQRLAELGRFAEFVIDDRLPVTVRVEEGLAAERILATADKDGAGLVVVGTHGRTGLDRLLLGSVAEEVIHRASCPVVTVRPVPGVMEAAGRRLRRIVYATDFSPASAKAWPWARVVMEATAGEVDLLHVLLPDGPEREPARRELEQWVAAGDLPSGRTQVHVAQGGAADEIVRLARARRADLIVLGTHGRTGLTRLALGSVARQVLHLAPCPVLTVGPSVAAGPTR